MKFNRMRPRVAWVFGGQALLAWPHSWDCSRWSFDDFPVPGFVGPHTLDAALLAQRLEVTLNGAGGFVKQTSQVFGGPPRLLRQERQDLIIHGRSRYAKLSIHDDSKVKIAPVHSDFLCDFGSLSLMGFAG